MSDVAASPALSLDAIEDVVSERTLDILARRRVGAIQRRRWLVRRSLVVADAFGLACAFLLAQLVAAPAGADFDGIALKTEFLVFLVTLPVWIVVAKLYGLYDRDDERAEHATPDEFVGVFHLISIGTWTTFAGAWLVGLPDPHMPKIVAFWIAAISFVFTGRAVARAVVRRSPSYIQNTLVVGAGEVGQMVARKILKNADYGLNVVGFVDSHPRARSDELGHVTVLGDLAEVPRIVRLLDVERVIIAFSGDSTDQTLDLLRELRGLDVHVDIVPRFFDAVGPKVDVHMIGGLPLLGLPPLRLPRSSRLIKSACDRVLALGGLLALSPLLAFIAVRIKLDSPGPVFYRHERIGFEGRPFRLVKFRTMKLESCRGAEYGGADADDEFARLMDDPAAREEFAKSQKLRDDPRVTRFGAFLRRTSLDELPQLFNVVMGDISLVGPRPVTYDELVRYGPDARQLLEAVPGVTGYWQINGRSELEYEERVRLDMAYITSWSLKLDIAILAKTLRVLFTRNGAY